MKKRIRIHPDKMDSILKHYILEDPIVQAIEEINPYVKEFLSKNFHGPKMPVTVIDKETLESKTYTQVKISVVTNF